MIVLAGDLLTLIMHPNLRLQRIAALLRFRMNLKGHGWAARAEAGR